MFSSRGRFTTGSTLRQYLLIERLSDDVAGSLWKAEDSVLGRVVAVKILHPEVTADSAQRDFITSEARHAAHLDHPGIARIYELDRLEDDLFLVLEHVEGQPLNRLVRGKALGRDWFLNLAEQIADAMHAAHVADVIHGNLHGWDVIVAEDGRAKLAGFGTGRASAGSGPVAEEAEDAEQAFYFSPERVVGRPLSVQSDIFSLGTILYEMATGTVPFPGGSPAEVCEKIVNRPPPAPTLINRAVDAGIVSVIGRCIQKDPTRRYQSTAHLLADLRKLREGESLLHSGGTAAAYLPLVPSPTSRAPIESSVISETVGEALDQLQETVLGEPAESSGSFGSSLRAHPRSADYATAVAEGRPSIILYASVAAAEGASQDSTSGRRAGIMQQILGEAVYLLDGRIVDPFGSRMVAEFDDPRRALDAARKGIRDLQAYNLSQPRNALQIPARLVLHAGVIANVGGSASGPAIDEAQSAALLLPPLTPALSSAVLALVGVTPSGQPLAEAAGVEFFNLPGDDEIPAAPEPDEESATVVAPSAPEPRSRRLALPLSIAAVIILLVVSALLVMRGSRIKAEARESQLRAAAEASARAVPAPAPGPRQITIDPFWSDFEATGAAVSTETIRMAVIGILDMQDGVRVVDSGETEKFSATLRQGPDGLEMVPIRIAPESLQGPPVKVVDAAVAARLLAAWISERLQMVPPGYTRTTPETIDLFARAVAERRSTGGLITPQLAEMARALARSDPNFVPGQVLALDAFEKLRDDASATASARAILSLDPRNLDIRKRFATIRARNGAAVEALNEFIAVLRERPEDREALRALGTYALAAGDAATFEKARVRIAAQGGVQPLHPPDMLLAAGRIDQAAPLLFELQESDPQNPVLSLKVGRVAVMRRMMTIADLELQKLGKIDPDFGHPLLNAYVLAERREAGAAAAELQRATASSHWFDSPYTHSAEVYALLGNTRGVLDSIERAVTNGEPTGSYLLNNPLFSYLWNDARFVRLRARIEAQVAAIRGALTSSPL